MQQYRLSNRNTDTNQRKFTTFFFVQITILIQFCRNCPAIEIVPSYLTVIILPDLRTIYPSTKPGDMMRCTELRWPGQLTLLVYVRSLPL